MAIIGAVFGSVTLAPSGDKLAKEDWDLTRQAVYSVDLGASAPHQKLEFQLAIANHLNVPIEILNIKTSCGCTVGTIDRGADGESWVLSGSVTTIGAVGTYPNKIVLEWKPVGSKEKTSISTLKLRTEVFKVSEVSATSVDFGTYDTTASKPIYREIEITNTGREPQWNTVLCAEQRAGIETRIWKKTEKSWVVGIMATPSSLPCGAYSDKLDLQLLLNESLVSCVSLQLGGVGKGDFEISPSIILVSKSDAAMSPPVVQIRGKGKQTPRLLKAPEIKGSSAVSARQIFSEENNLAIQLELPKSQEACSGIIILNLSNDTNYNTPRVISVPFVVN